MNKKIVGLLGFIGSGKDTVADYLVNEHNFKRGSYASSLKDAVSAVFGWDREMLEGRTDHARETREKIDTWWSERLNIPDLTPRKVLQQWGTELCRDHFHNDIWVASLERKILTGTENVVISDCRFPNEVETIRSMGGTLIMVRRGPLPVWFDTAKSAASGSRKDIIQLDKLGVHPSEWEWAATEFDHVIENDKSLVELYSTIDKLEICNRL